MPRVDHADNAHRRQEAQSHQDGRQRTFGVSARPQGGAAAVRRLSALDPGLETSSHNFDASKPQGVRPSEMNGDERAAMKLGHAALLSGLALAACSLGSTSPESEPTGATTSQPAPTHASSRPPDAAPPWANVGDSGDTPRVTRGRTAWATYPPSSAPPVTTESAPRLATTSS